MKKMGKAKPKINPSDPLPIVHKAGGSQKRSTAGVGIDESTGDESGETVNLGGFPF